MSIVLIVNNYYTMRFQPDCHCILILLHEESYIMCCPRAQQLCMHQHTCGNFNFQGMLVMLHVEKATGVVWGGCDKSKIYIGQKGPSCSHALELIIVSQFDNHNGIQDGLLFVVVLETIINGCDP